MRQGSAVRSPPISLSRRENGTCIERFSLDCRKGLVLVLVLLRPLVG